MPAVDYKKARKPFLSTPMRKTYTFASVTVLIVVVFLVGAISPTLSTISRLQSEITERKGIEERLQRKINNIDSLRKKYTEREGQLTFIDSLFPVNSDQSVLMANCEKIAGLYNFELQSFGSESLAEGEMAYSAYANLTPMIVRVVVTGHQQQLIKLLDHFESFPQIPEITRINFAPDPQEGAGMIRVNIEMIVFRSKEVITDTNL